MKVFAVFLALALPVQAALAEPFRLIITDTEAPLVPNSIVDIALAGGYFDRAGVEVELVRVQQTPMALTALQAGEGEMANLSTETVISWAARGFDNLRAVTSPDKALPYLIAGRPGVTLETLKGQRFGIGRPGSLDQMLSQKVLEAHGISSDSLQLMALGQPAVRAQALLAGQIDATTLSVGTFLALPGAGDLPVLVSPEAYYAAAPVVSKVNAVTTGTLANRRPEIEAVITALTLAARDMAAEPGAWAGAMAPLRSDIAPGLLDRLSQSYQNAWSVNGGLQAAELQATSDWLYQQPDFKDLPVVPLSAWADFGPLDQVLERIGTSAEGDLVSR